MCTLAIYRDVSARFPLVIAANRDEVLDRPSAGPAPLADLAGVVAGRDLEAGGTWLGARNDGTILVAGLLNRRPGPEARAGAPGERSRGLLCLDALRGPDVDAVVARVAAEDVGRYAGFNLLIADRGRGVVIDNRDGVNVTELGAGLSVLTNLDVNDPRCPRLASAVPGFEAVAAVLHTDPQAQVVVAELAAVLGDHRNSVDSENSDPFARLCVHAGPYGTRSATVILIGADGGIGYYHADGAPCTAVFRSVLG